MSEWARQAVPRLPSNLQLPPRRAVLVVVLVLALVVTSVGSGVSIDVAAATETLDTCGVITEPGVYSLTGDVTADRLVCLDVVGSDVVISGGGASILGTGADESVGIRVGPDVTNVTVTDLTVSNFQTGILLDTATDVTVADVSVTDNSFFGIDVQLGGSHHIRNVTADANFVGINFARTSDNVIEDATARRSNRNGIALSRSPNNRFTDVSTNDNLGNGVLVRSASTGNKFVRHTAVGNDANGIRVFAAVSNNEFVDLVADGNGVTGLSFQNDVRGNVVTDATARENGEWDYYSADDTVNNTITRLDVGTATVSFTARDVGVRSVSPTPVTPTDLQTVDGTVEVAAIPDSFDGSSDAPSYLDVTVDYNDTGIDESSVAFYRYDAETEAWTSLESAVDTETNTVSTNTTVFGILAPLAAEGEPSDGVEQVLVTLVETDEDLAALDRGSAIDVLRSHAVETQTPLLEYADTTEDVTVLRPFWLTNAVLLAVNTTTVSLEELESIEGVTGVVPNNESFAPPPFESDAVTDPATADTGGAGTTYGLEQVNATGVWSGYSVRGENVTVAVLDTGIDPSHPDLSLYTTDPTDPTYPGGWAEFNDTGGAVTSNPYDAGNNGIAFAHGTHVSGTVAGGNTSGTAIGVAPEARLLHGGVLMQCGSRCGGTTAQVIAGMQWAVQEDADVISMSLGSRWYNPGYVGPVRNARNLGIFVVAAAGNNGPNTAGSPGRVYESFSVGASNESEGIAYFSGGEVVETETDWGPFAPEDWPSRYVVPVGSAPGVLVVSASPGGAYASANGTSMATPHVAGVAALVISAAGGSGSISPEELEQVLVETASKPAVCEPSCTPREGQDTRYGWGIVDAYAAVERVTLTTGIEGTVTDTSGAPIAGATVSAGGFSRTTDANGSYTLRLDPGTYTVTVDALGYAPETQTVSVVATTLTTLDVVLQPTLDVQVVSEPPDKIQARDYADATFAVRNVENVTVELASTNNYAASDLTLTVNGRVTAPGETVTFAAPVDDDAFTVRADTAAGTSGALRLSYTFGGLNETVPLTLDTTTVVPETVRRVAVVEEFYDDDAVNFTAIMATELGPDYEVDYVKTYQLPALVDRHAYDVYIIQSWGEDLTDAEVQQFVDDTAASDVGVIFLDGYESCSSVNGNVFCSDVSDAINRLSEVTGDPASVDDRKDHDFYQDETNYRILINHPIFDGLGIAGDDITINTDLYATSRFSGYSGTVIADVRVVEYTFGGDVENSLVTGSGVAVNDARGHVLLATLGRTTRFAERDSPFDADWTDESYDVIQNTVEYLGPVWATPDVVVESYSLSTTSTRPGDPVVVTATVENRGTASETVDVTLYADLQQTDQQVTVAAGGTETVTFPAVSFADPGSYYVTVGDAAGVLRPTPVTVADPANVSVSYTVATTSVDLNEPVVVNATATNVGTSATPVEIAFSVDGRVTDTRSLTLQPSETRSVEFETQFVDEGTHTVTVNGLPPTTVTATNRCLLVDAPGTYTLNESIRDSPTTQCIRITSSDVIFDGGGLTLDGVTGPQSVGVFVANTSGTSTTQIANVTVRNLVVTDWITGVRFDSVTDGRIENVVVSDAYGGIEVDRSTTMTVRDVLVTETFTGVEISRTDGVLLRNVTATDGGVGVDVLQSTTNATLIDVTVLNNSVGVDATADRLDIVGLYAVGNGDGATLGGSLLTVSDAVLEGNADVGLDVDVATGATVTGVSATGNGGEGVAVSRSSGVVLRDLLVTDNGRAGLDVDNADGTVVVNVTATGNDDGGLSLSRSDALSVEVVSAVDNDGGGIDARTLSNASVRDVEARSNQRHGVFVDVSTNATFARVNASDNDGYGLLLWRSSGIDGRDVVASGNTGDGLQLWAADDNTFNGLSLSNNLGAGLRLEAASDNEFREVDASGNTGPAFEATDGSANNLVIDLTVNPTLSFRATDVTVDVADRVSAPPTGLVALGPAVTVTANAPTASVDLTVPYTDELVETTGANESTLALYLHDGTSWAQLPSTLLSGENRVEATLDASTGFGVVALLGEPDAATVITTPTANGTEATVENAATGEPVEIPLDVAAGDDISLTSMTVTTNTDTDYTLTVNGSADAPTGQETLAIGTGTLTLGYLTVEHTVPDAEVDEVRFRFSVSESALDASGTDPSNVTLYRYASGTWGPVPTTLVATTGIAPDRTFTYEAVSPGLSVFAIGGAQAVSVVDATLVDADVLVGDTVTATVTLENAAADPALAPLSLTVNGTTVTTVSPVVAPGTSEYNVSATVDASGRFAVAVNGVPAGTVTVREPIAVDALTGDDGPAPIRPNANQVLVVAVLNESGFDPATLDTASIRVGDAATVPDDTVAPVRLIQTDVDDDGDVDLMLHVPVGEMNLDADTTALAVLGETTTGTPVYGEFEVRVSDGARDRNGDD